MNQEQAEKFVYKLMVDVWEKGREDLLEKFYVPKVIGHYRNQTFGFAEIKNRMVYNNARYHKRKYHLNDIACIDANTIVFRVRQTGIDTYYGKIFSYNLVAIYRVSKEKITELWLMPDMALDYLAVSIGDIKNRASYVKAHYLRIHNEVLEVISDGNKIAVRLKQTYFDKNNAQILCYHLIATYHIDGDKISHLYCLSDPPFNYYE